MGTPVAVHWHEGLFLRPQHLQMLQKSIFDSAMAEGRLSRAYPYGVVAADLDVASLENMMVRYRQLARSCRMASMSIILMKPIWHR